MKLNKKLGIILTSMGFIGGFLLIRSIKKSLDFKNININFITSNDELFDSMGPCTCSEKYNDINIIT